MRYEVKDNSSLVVVMLPEVSKFSTSSHADHSDEWAAKYPHWPILQRVASQGFGALPPSVSAQLLSLVSQPSWRFSEVTNLQ